MGKPLPLISQHAANTIIDATGRSNGVDIDGIDNAGFCQRRRDRVFRGSIINLALVGRLKGKVE
jgi:hypothetical protein